MFWTTLLVAGSIRLGCRIGQKICEMMENNHEKALSDAVESATPAIRLKAIEEATPHIRREAGAQTLTNLSDLCKSAHASARKWSLIYLFLLVATFAGVRYFELQPDSWLHVVCRWTIVWISPFAILGGIRRRLRSQLESSFRELQLTASDLLPLSNALTLSVSLSAWLTWESLNNVGSMAEFFRAFVG